MVDETRVSAAYKTTDLPEAHKEAGRSLSLVSRDAIESASPHPCRHIETGAS